MQWKARDPPEETPEDPHTELLKKTFNQEQFIFTTPISKDPVVAINAQFFTVSDPWFSELVDGWMEKGLIRQCPGTIGELEVGGWFVPPHSSPPRYIGTIGELEVDGRFVPHLSSLPPGYRCVNGMCPLLDSILSQGKMCKLLAWFVRLTTDWKTNDGVPKPFQLGPCNGTNRLELSSMWAISIRATFEIPLPIPGSTVATRFKGAFVKGVDAVSWMANNTRKLFFSQSSSPHWDGQFSACEVTLVQYEDMGIHKDMAKLGVRHGMSGTVKKIHSGVSIRACKEVGGITVQKCTEGMDRHQDSC
ncbi:hypothetical protein HHK36_022610 [Tetracentron sinense]|uniref:Uncharacterized protein n=1 Tax=Tetracentron sinense TaxID=13715 RepID=A0A835D6A0_TETSI|nr:hypothetical protein HHK36_022610 [Tetracentron sinense]